MNCPNCGAQRERKQRFCGVCGTDCESPTPDRRKSAMGSVTPAETPQQPAKIVSPEDFFEPVTPRRNRRMGDVSVESIDISKLERRESNGNRYMKAAGEADAASLEAFQRKESKVKMTGAGTANAEDLDAYVHVSPRVNMHTASEQEIDRSNLDGSYQKHAKVAMSDELKVVQDIPQRSAVEDAFSEELPAFIRARRNHSISLEIPTLESI